jgi:hypothetical protein
MKNSTNKAPFIKGVFLYLEKLKESVGIKKNNSGNSSTFNFGWFEIT